MNAPQVHSSASSVQNLIGHSLVPAIFIDCNLLILQVNQAMADLLNQSVAALTSLPFHHLFSGTIPTPLANYLNRPPMHNGPADGVWGHIGLAQIEVWIVALSGEFGGPIGFLVQAAPQIRSSNSLDWEAALHGAGQGVWDYNIATGEKLYSKTWHDMRGASKADAAATEIDYWLTTIHPEDLEATKKHAADLEAGLLQDVNFEYRERHLSGHWMWIMCRGRPIEWDSVGHPTRYVGTDTDITALKSVQDAVTQLSATDIRWKNALESTVQGLWDVNEINGERFHSAQWFRMRGLPENTVAQHEMDEWLGRIHPEDVERVKRDIRLQRIPYNDIIEMEYRERHKNGHWQWILSRGKVVQRNEENFQVRVIGFDTDITGIKSSDDKIKRMSKRLEMALTSSKIGVWEFDWATNRVHWDSVMREMYGLPNDQAPLPREIWETSLHPDDRDATITKALAGQESKESYDLDYRIVLNDGTVKHLRSRASFDDNGIDGLKLLGLNWDVTEDIHLAQKLKDANDIALKRNKQLEVARSLMEYNALHDALTGQANRRMLDQVQKSYFDNPEYQNVRFAVLHVDLDRFKQINDTLGHDAGDAVLIHTANVLRETVGPDDLVARVGGDEFAVFIANAPDEAALLALARNIIAKTSAPIKYQHHDCRCGVSIGIAYAKASDIDGNALLINADMAMYRSKHSGRGGCSVFNDDMKREALEKKNRSDELLTGLDRDEFFCVYQPQYDCKTLQFIGVEALVRWNNPAHGVMSPCDFLPLAEELQVIDRIDKTVLGLAISDLAHWQDAGLVIPRLSINISGRRLCDPQLAQELSQLLVPKGILSFEFLESIFLDEPDKIQAANIACIRRLGIGIEVDDFGSGHSSIVSLLKLKPDRLKIDRTIIEPVTRSARQRHLVQSIVDIGKLQGIKVLAEGVETTDHIKILQTIGCDELQGYALSRPLSASQLMTLLTPALT